MDICEIIEKALLITNKVTNDVLMRSLDELEKSKKAIEEYNFRGKNPVLMVDGDNETKLSEAPSNKHRPIVR